MKPLLVHNSADLYGASRSLLRLCRQLKASAISPVVILPERGPLVPMLERDDIQVLIFPGLRVITRPVLKSLKIIPWLIGFIPSSFALARIIKDSGASVVHTNTGVICSSALAARIAGIPHIWHIRDWFQEFGPLWKPYSRYILALSNKVICVSRAIASQFPASQKLCVINNGFDLDELPSIKDAERAAARENWAIPPNALVVGTVGRLKFVRKGQEFLLQAIAQLSVSNPPVYALLAGGNPPGADDQMDKMQELAKCLGIPDRVIFTGELPDARPAYAAMDLFVLPSAQPEPFGGVVMEAMAYELPVIGTSIGGTVDQIDPEVTGLLVPPSNPTSLANAIRILADAKDRRLRMGKAGRLRIQDRFSMEQFFFTIMNIYREASAESKKSKA